MDRITYHDQTDMQNVLKLREVLRTLPEFARDYFRAIDATTTTKTRISYAYDIRIFFQFLVQENPLKYLYRHLGITVTVPSHLETILPQLPLQKSLPSQQTLPSLRPLRPRKLLQKQPQILLLQQKPLQKTLLPRFRPTKLSYRYSFFVPLTRYGVIRSVMTLFFLWVMQDF